MNFRHFRNETKVNTFETKDVYVMTCDLDQRRKKKLGDVEITMLLEYENDHRLKHPNIGEVHCSSEGSEFSKGQKVICKHFTFENGSHKSNEFVTFRGTKYFLVNNFNVIAGITETGLVPRRGILLCEPVYGNFLKTDFKLTGEVEGRRRDIAKVISVGQGISDVKTGDYVMLTVGGDYQFEWNGKTYIKVDTHYGDTYATTDTDDTYDSVLQKHMKHGKTLRA